MNTLNSHSTSETDDLLNSLEEQWDALENDPEFQKKPVWQKIIEIGKVVPQEEWRKQLPKDFACNAEHYMYGAPREDENT